jgi:hypothetical protein
MASKKVSPAELAKLAKIKTGGTAPNKAVPKETPPPTVPESDWEDLLFGTTTTTTTTVPPVSGTPTTTVAPGTIAPPRGKGPKESLSVNLDKRISEIEGQLFGKATPQTIAKVKTGEVKKGPLWKRALSATFNNPIAEITVLRPLKTLAFVGRVGVSTFEESAQWASENLPGGRGTQRYEPTDYIPTHPQTKVPLAKVGDPVIRNVDEILATPISDEAIKKANLARTEAEQKKILNEATMDIVNSKKRTAAGSWGEWARQIGTPTEFKDYGFGDIAEVQIGRQLVEAGKVSPAVGKWIDRGIGLTGDIVLDPTTYVSMGTTTAAKSVVNSLGDNADLLVRLTAGELRTASVKDATKAAAVQIADITGEKVTSKAVQTQARAVVAESAKLLKEQALAREISGLSGNIEKKIAEANRRWSAIAPRREVGAGSRQATAAMVSDLRDEALDVIRKGTDAGYDQSQVNLAKKFVKVITDDVIKDIAVRGNTAIKGPVAQALSTPGGLRWGMGKFKVSIPGSQKITEPIGAGFALPRQALAATKAGRSLINATTRIGEGGLFGSEYVFNWRTGLRSGYSAQTGQKLTGKEAVEAIKRLSEDQVYRALKKTTSQTIKQGVDSVFRVPEFKQYFNTVHEILTNPAVDWNKTAQEIADEIDRPLAEVQLAMRVKDLGNEFYRIIEGLSASLGGNPVVLPDNWFPETLNDKAVMWLNKGTKEAREALVALGLSTPPIAGRTTAEQLEAGVKWFGHRLSPNDIKAGVTRFNYLANNPAPGYKPFKGQFFDTNVASAVEKWARKFSDDYAFLRSAIRGNLEDSYASGARSTPSSILIQDKVETIARKDLAEFLVDVQGGRLIDVDSTIVKQYAEKLGLSSDDVVDVARTLSDDIDNRLPELYSEHIPSMFSPSGVRRRINYILIEKRLNNLLLDDTLDELRRVASGRRTEILRTPKTPRNADILADQEYVISQIQAVLNEVYDEMAVGGKTAREFINGLDGVLKDELEDLQVLFAQSPEKFQSIIDNIDPRVINTMINMTEDAFVMLDNKIVPDLYAKREVAQMFYNVSRLKDPKFQNGFIRWVRNYNRFIKTWVTNTPGFHSRNTLSNAWQMIAGGSQLRNLEEGRSLLNDWNKFVKRDAENIINVEQIIDDILNLPDTAVMGNPKLAKIARTLNVPQDDVLNMKFIMEDVIARRGVPRDDWRFLADFANIKTRMQDPELLIDDFLTQMLETTKYSPAELNAFRETMMWSGAAGFGDIEEVFGAAVPSRLGITGAEVPVRTTPIGRAASKTSETIAGIPLIGPRSSRSFGGKIENYSRFMMTYDGIRQGLTPEQAAARTARFLVDYEDLTQLDYYAKLIFPFWMWMSRNLPVQTANMFMNPKTYAIYQNFRENFEDKEGRNALLPSYLKDAGLFKAPFGEDIYIKPDLGFPGAGSPSPLQTGVTDWRSLLSAIPAYSLGSAALGQQAFSGSELEGAGEILPEVTRQALPPLSVLGRYASGLGAAGSDLPGPEWLQRTLGVRGPRESGKAAQIGRDFASLFGLPGTLVGADQENAARYEQIRRLEAYKKWLESQGG